MSKKPIKPCPNCGSRDVEHKNDDMHRTTHSALHHGSHELGHVASGHPGMLLAVAGLWAAKKVAHSFSKPWTCKKCHHSYS